MIRARGSTRSAASSARSIARSSSWSRSARLTAQKIGAAKRELGMPTRDFRQEQRRRPARAPGRDRARAARVARRGARARAHPRSLTVQEKDTIATAGEGSGRRVLVIGGAGHMGAWFVRYLRAQGFTVEIADPADGPDGVLNHRDWRRVDARSRAGRDRRADAGDQRRSCSTSRRRRRPGWCSTSARSRARCARACTRCATPARR